MKKNSLLVCFLLIFISYFSYSQWIQCGVGGRINTIVISGNKLFVGADKYFGYSTDNGDTWNDIYSYAPGVSSGPQSIAVSGSNIFIVCQSYGLFRSTNSGKDWQEKDNGMTASSISAIGAIGNHIFAGVGNDIFLSTDNGETWVEKNNGLTGFSTVYTFAFNGGSGIYAATNGGIFISTNFGDLWTTNDSSNFNCFSILFDDNKIYAGTDQGLFLSTNFGSTWMEKDNGITNKIVRAIAKPSEFFIMTDKYTFAGSDADGIFFSNDFGATWVPKNTGLSNLSIYSIAIGRDYIFVGTDAQGADVTLYKEKLTDFGISDGVTDNNSTQKFNIYPDPVTDILTIETQSSYYKELKIYDLVGTKISSAKILNDKISIDLTTFLPGVYFLNLGNEIKMFIKE